jgi:hypothetical protein
MVQVVRRTQLVEVGYPKTKNNFVDAKEMRKQDKYLAILISR